MIAYFYGSDTYGARQAITTQAARESTQIRWLDSRDLVEQPLKSLVQQEQGLFGRELLVVLDPSRATSAVQQDVVAVVTEGYGNVIFWDRGDVDKRSSLWRAVRSLAVEFAPLPLPALSGWLQEEAKRQACAISKDVAEVLISRAGVDRWRLKNELERLSLQSEAITVDMVKRDVDSLVLGEIFSMLDALAQGEPRRTIQQLERLWESGSNEFYILTMLAYQFRALLVVAEGLAAGKTQQSIAREAKVHSFVVEKHAKLVRRLSSAMLREALTRIMATDYAIKAGTVDARTALVMLVLNLVRQQQRALARV